MVTKPMFSKLCRKLNNKRCSKGGPCVVLGELSALIASTATGFPSVVFGKVTSTQTQFYYISSASRKSAERALGSKHDFGL